MKKLFKWQYITLIILGVITFISFIVNNNSFIDIFLGILINILILWVIFQILM